MECGLAVWMMPLVQLSIGNIKWLLLAEPGKYLNVTNILFIQEVVVYLCWKQLA